MTADNQPMTPEEPQPGAVYAELHEPDAATCGLGAVWNRHSMRDFADRTHALRKQAEEGHIKLLAECRCAFPVPEPGSPLEMQWAAAMACPEEVPKYVRMCVASMQAATKVAPQQDASPTAGMSIAQRILHVGGRNNAAGYVEFGSIQAVEALVRQVLRDLPAAPQQEVQEPLTGKQREAIWQECRYDNGEGWEVDCWEVIDAVERTHRIKGGQHVGKVD